MDAGELSMAGARRFGQQISAGRVLVEGCEAKDMLEGKRERGSHSVTRPRMSEMT